MNVLFVTHDHSIKNFGVTTVVSQLADELAIRNNDIQITIATTGRNSVHQSRVVTIELRQPAGFGAFWTYRQDLISCLNDIITRYHIDLIHVHGIWAAVQWAGLMVAKNRGIPCIVSSHAMLEPWYWNRQGLLKNFKKKIYFNFVLRRAISEYTILHAITLTEKNSLQKLFPKQGIVVIQNAISLYEENNLENNRKIIIPEKIFLFLGRLHPVKGVDLLVDAFYRANLESEWKLVLAGPESAPKYVQKIRTAVSKYGLSNRVKIIGPVYGTKKQELIQKAWAVAVPSYCEVIGMVNLEASACMVPTITTFETGLWDWEEGGGILIHPNVDELEHSLLKISRWSMAERLYYGSKSFELVANKYSFKTVAAKWEALYSSLMRDRTLGIAYANQASHDQSN